MRAPIWMICGLFLAILIMDLASVWMVRGKIIQAVEHSMDAALVDGVQKAYTAKGFIFIDEERGRDSARYYFKQTLKLNDRLENELLKKTVFMIDFLQDGERPRITARVFTVIEAMSPRLFGLNGVPVTIGKTQYSISKYK